MMRDELCHVRALILDCDGVLTDGSITYDAAGGRSLTFYARDALGIALLTRAGIQVAILSGRPTDIAQLRHQELGVRHFVGGCRNKAKATIELQKDMGVNRDTSVFVGDDVVDLGGFAHCATRVAVADCAPEVRAAANWVTQAKGGRGAVREVCEAILKARGSWESMVQELQGAS